MIKFKAVALFMLALLTMGAGIQAGVQGGEFGVYLPMVAKPPELCSISDDFSDAGSGWAVETEGLWQSEYVNGKYRMFNNGVNWWFLSVMPGDCSAENYTTSVEANWWNDNNSSYALAFGITPDESEYYELIVKNEFRAWGLFYRNAETGTEETLKLEVNQEIVNPGRQSNLITVTRLGSEIIVELNETEVFRTVDLRITGETKAGVMLITGGNSNLQAEARFDNFLFEQLP